MPTRSVDKWRAPLLSRVAGNRRSQDRYLDGDISVAAARAVPRGAGSLRVICIALVGDLRVNREALAAALAHDGRLKVATHGRASETVRLERSDAEVVVVDTGGSDGTEAVRQLVVSAHAPIVALGAPDDDEDVIALAELGVLGFVDRDADLDELVAAVIGAARGEPVFPPRIATALLRRVSTLRHWPASSDGAGLTMREREVVELIAEGLSNKEISSRLSIEVATVKNHVHNILEKLGVERRSDAVARLRLVERDDLPAPRFLRVAVPRSNTGASAH